MKRASDVPPVVESFGFRPVTSVIALADHLDERPGRGEEHVGVRRLPFDVPADAVARRLRGAPLDFSSRSSARVRVSLKRMLKRARASAGIRLTVLLPTSIEVNSRFDGAKCSVPLSSGSALSAAISVAMPRTGLSAQFRIGDVALRAGDDQRAVLRAAPADLDHVAELSADWSARPECSGRISRRARPPIRAA